jgi:protein ImuB
VLWIALYLPEWSLQAALSGALQPMHALPMVIAEGPAQRLQVCAANAVARAGGIEIGMPIAAARAREAGLLVLPRQIDKEQRALRQLAMALLPFSPLLAFEPARVMSRKADAPSVHEGLSLEVSTTLKLFGGLAALLGRLRACVKALGVRAVPGIAPTPLAAWLLAKSAAQGCGARPCEEAQDLAASLADVPLVYFDWPPATQQHLHGLGFARVRDLMRQPRAGLRKRLGETVVDDLDRALARLPDAREPYVPPEQFTQTLDLLFDTADAARLMSPLRRLLEAMEGFLRARGRAARAVRVDFIHGRHAQTALEFGARIPIAAAERWETLLRERLLAQPLSARVSALRVVLLDHAPQPATNESWLPATERTHEDWQRLIDRLVSRLGERRVFGVAVVNDHRPEAAWAVHRCGEKRIERPVVKADLSQRLRRPLLLLTQARSLTVLDGAPQLRGALRLIAGPERIDTGWWDGRPVARDYYIATNREHELLWIYRDYRFGRRWFLQGVFA